MTEILPLSSMNIPETSVVLGPECMHKLPDWIASIRQRRRKRGKRTLTDLPSLPSDFGGGCNLAGDSNSVSKSSRWVSGESRTPTQSETSRSGSVGRSRAASSGIVSDYETFESPGVGGSIFQNSRFLEPPNPDETPSWSYEGFNVGIGNRGFCSAPPSARAGVRHLPVHPPGGMELNPLCSKDENIYASVCMMPSRPLQYGNRKLIRTNPWLPPPTTPLSGHQGPTLQGQKQPIGGQREVKGHPGGLEWDMLTPSPRPLTPEKFSQALKNPAVDDLSSSGYSSHDSSPESSLHSPRWAILPPFGVDQRSQEQQEKSLTLSIEDVCDRSLSPKIFQISPLAQPNCPLEASSQDNFSKTILYPHSTNVSHTFIPLPQPPGNAMSRRAQVRSPGFSDLCTATRSRKPVMINSNDMEKAFLNPVTTHTTFHHIPKPLQSPTAEFLEISQDFQVSTINRLSPVAKYIENPQNALTAPERSEMSVESRKPRRKVSKTEDKAVATCEISFVDDMEFCEDCATDCDCNGNPVRLICDNASANLLLAELDKKLARLKERAKEVSDSTQRAKDEYREFSRSKELLYQNIGMLRNLRWVIHGSEVHV